MPSRRYEKHHKLKGFGHEGQEKLAQGKVLIIGAGGLGTPAAQYLNSIGVGTIGLVDGDLIEESNLPRQTLYTPNDIGQPKSQTLIHHLQKQNPETNWINHRKFLTVDNALEIISKYDLIIDASDNFGTRYLVNDACVILDKPFIYGALHNFEGQVSVLNYKNGPTYRCLFPESNNTQTIPNCDENGVLGVLPGLIGTYQAIEAVKVITGIGETLSGKLLIIDILSQSHHKIGVPNFPQNHQITQLKESYRQPVCNSPGIKNLDPHTYQDWILEGKPIEIIDVRSMQEASQDPFEKGKNIPLDQLEKRHQEINTVLPVVLVCQAGKRSQLAGQILEELSPQFDLYNLKGGINHLRETIL
ncbi:HesA/MoeB/ThiF family protein [Echinicola jeungdonensis]|uniref:ThiF family adenylyltransferase n=1 Tax=Echinicola jeungdonensis TaxID=709343 RepID=A0ABV5J892_9BACT|nr:HesA/MoeB/ThiF family protein [Echinicola jeungdonensis]MDN3669649.1 HesA/MoeB/ThiF family protein [Echinicola jeungdonensis]